MVRRFITRVEETALGVKVLKGVKPDQQLVKVSYFLQSCILRSVA